MNMLHFIEDVINLRRADYPRDSLLLAVRGKGAYRRLLRDVMLLALKTWEEGPQSTWGKWVSSPGMWAALVAGEGSDLPRVSRKEHSPVDILILAQ